MYSSLKIRIVLSISIFFLSASSLANAISIDEFDGQQPLVLVSGTSAFSGPGIIGGARTLNLNVLAGGGNLLAVDQGRYKHAQGPGDRAISTVIWDGDTNFSEINYAGLGGIDITSDNATAFTLAIDDFDYAFNNSMDLVMTIYDASDVTGKKSSSAVLTLKRLYTFAPAVETLPFSAFTNSGVNGPASFRNVGAMKLEVKGLTPAIDFMLGFLRTNGRCPGVPAHGVIVDQCGVCGGNNSTCAGCDGVPNSGKRIDTCGICGGNSTSCLGCDGVPFSNKTIDQCGVCGGNGTSCLDCTGFPNGGATLDRCNVCKGDGSSCLGCSETDITDVLFALDGNALAQKALVFRALRNIEKTPGAASLAKFVEKTKAQANELYVTSWTFVWSNGKLVKTCTNTTFCVKTDNSSNIAQLKSNSLDLYSLLQRTVKKLIRARGKTAPIDFTLLHRGENLHLKNIKLSDSLPGSRSACE